MNILCCINLRWHCSAA